MHVQFFFFFACTFMSVVVWIMKAYFQHTYLHVLLNASELIVCVFLLQMITVCYCNCMFSLLLLVTYYYSWPSVFVSTALEQYHLLLFEQCHCFELYPTQVFVCVFDNIMYSWDSYAYALFTCDYKHKYCSISLCLWLLAVNV